MGANIRRCQNALDETVYFKDKAQRKSVNLGERKQIINVISKTLNYSEYKPRLGKVCEHSFEVRKCLNTTLFSCVYIHNEGIDQYKRPKARKGQS